MSHVLDRASRAFWQLTGRRIDLDGDDAWLDAPVSATAHVGAEWVTAEAARHGGLVAEADSRAGLVPSMAVLDRPGFSADDLAPQVRDFYEHTAAWRMEVWSRWSPWFWPGGELVSRLWGRRVEQLALPMSPLDMSRGMDSSVVPVLDAAGAQVSAAWTRVLRSDGRTMFSGAYATRALPGADGPSVHVAFPLESGNLQVFLRPTNLPGGGLLLTSQNGSFGEDGAYVVVHGRRSHAARVPLHETFRMYLDEYGVLRTDHELKLWNASALRLHYRMEPV